MKKLLPLLLLACTVKQQPASPRNEIARQQTELKAEYNRLMDSVAANPHPAYSSLPDEIADSVAFAQGRFDRRISELKRKSDSLSNVMKAWEADSIIRSR